MILDKRHSFSVLNQMRSMGRRCFPPTHPGQLVLAAYNAFADSMNELLGYWALNPATGSPNG